MMFRLVLAGTAVLAAHAQQSQNPSPMVEHSRAHSRLRQTNPPGKRERLELGTLFVPPRSAPVLLVFFHGGDWLPETAAARHRIAAITVQAGSGSGTYANLFTNPDRFPRLLEEANTKAGIRFRRVILGGWSAGCGALRQILRAPASYPLVDTVLCIDGIHAGYLDGKPGPLESKIDPGNLGIWLQLARDAIAGRKHFLVTHSEIFPGTFASTTETADWLLAQLGLKPRPVLRWGPMGTQQLSEAGSGRFRMIGFAGNSAPDHVDQLHSLSEYLNLLL